MSSLYKPGQIIGGGAPESNIVSIAFRVDKDNGDGTYVVTSVTGANVISFLLEPHKHLATNPIQQGGLSVKIKYSGEIPEEFHSGKMSGKELLSFMTSQVHKGVTQ